MASTTIYGSFAEDVAKGNIDLDTDTFYIMLTTGYTPNASTHTKRSDVTASEITGTGYTAGGQALGSITVNRSGAVTTFDAADSSWTTSTITSDKAVIYKRRGGAASADELVCCLDFGSTTSTAGTFTVQFGASGILTFTVNA